MIIEIILFNNNINNNNDNRNNSISNQGSTLVYTCLKRTQNS